MCMKIIKVYVSVQIGYVKEKMLFKNDLDMIGRMK